MRTIIWILLLSSTQTFGQLFSFIDTTTTIVKTVNQSPAHWYLELENLGAVDTTLRWKCVEINAPAAWDFNFDDQDSLYYPVNLGDSAEFNLYAQTTFPKKLIIGGHFNNVEGNGYIKFLIYNPENLNERQNIYYFFEVSPITFLPEEIQESLKFYADHIKYSGKEEVNLRILNLSGQIMAQGQDELIIADLAPQVYILEFRIEDSVHHIKWQKK